MKGTHWASGFTIVETMIVLAVTGIILLSAIALMQGRTNKAEFSQAINDLQTQIQQVANDVANGYYPNNTNFTCTGSAGGPSIIPGSNGQGTNIGCVFMGKTMDFTTTAQASAGNQSFVVHTVVGLQCESGENGANCAPPTSVSSAIPTILSNSDTTDTLENGLYLIGHSVNGGQLATGSVSVGFIGNAAQATGPNNPSLTVAPGSQQVSLYTSAVSSGVNPQVTLTQQTEVDLCFASATDNQSGEIILGGGNGAQDSVNLTLYSGKTC